jgi:hypothetical protein
MSGIQMPTSTATEQRLSESRQPSREADDLSLGEASGAAVLVARGAPPGWLLPSLRLAALGIAALHTGIAIRHQSMNEDGINYLDIGTAFTSGDWPTAVNAIWSPLYAWMLGVVVLVTQPSIRWEFPIAQVTNFGIFAVALVCFEFFWRQLTARYYDQPVRDGAAVRFPPDLWLVLGYSLFIWSSLNLITIWAVTPDMLVAACAYLGAGLLLQLSGTAAPARTSAILGAVCGVGYLAKAAMFPMGLLCMLLAATVRAPTIGSMKRLVWMLVPFVIVAGPLVGAVSRAAGYVTFGDVGRFTYVKHVSGLRYPHGEPPEGRVTGAPLHAPQRVFEQPDVYAFAEPIGGTYPLSFDPGYWTRGLSPTFDFERQMRVVADNVATLFDLFVRTQGGYMAIVLLLVVLALTGGVRPVRRSPETALVVWALCAFGLYAVVYLESRYIAPFVVIFWAGLLAQLTLPAGDTSRRLVAVSAAVLTVTVWTNIGAFNLSGLGALLGFSSGSAQRAGAVTAASRFSGGSGAHHVEIAERLAEIGVGRGDRVGFVGYSFGAFWARLARVRIVAEIAPEEAPAFWQLDSKTHAAVMRVFADAGAVAVVSEPMPGSLIPSGWQPVGQTGYVVRLLGAHRAELVEVRP